MLCLSRKRSQSIQIGKDITVMVIEIRGDKVRLGITAPRTTKVMREELLQAAAAGRLSELRNAMDYEENMPSARELGIMRTDLMALRHALKAAQEENADLRNHVRDLQEALGRHITIEQESTP